MRASALGVALLAALLHGCGGGAASASTSSAAEEPGPTETAAAGDEPTSAASEEAPADEEEEGGCGADPSRYETEQDACLAYVECELRDDWAAYEEACEGDPPQLSEEECREMETDLDSDSRRATCFDD